MYEYVFVYSRLSTTPSSGEQPLQGGAEGRVTLPRVLSYTQGNIEYAMKSRLQDLFLFYP